MIGRMLRWIAIAIGVVVLAIGALFVGARFADGPIGPIAGGAFSSGEVFVGGEPDWRFLTDAAEVEFQLLEPARSRTTWILEHEGRVYIPCGYMDSPLGRLWKQWPHEAERDGRALLRVDGVLYERRMVRVRDGDAVPALAAELVRKYLGGASLSDPGREAAIQAVTARVADGSLWLFELRPAASA